MAKWLDKYEQGGLVLKKKTKDNYDLKANVNDVQASVGPGFVGAGYDTTGRNYSPAWGGQFQDGGSLWNTDRTAWVDSIHNARKGDLNFVQRYFDQSAGSIQIPGQRGTSTHFMESGDGKAYPTVVQMPNGKLQYLNQNDKNAAWNYANKTGQFIKFPTDEQAAWYADNGYKKGTGVLKKKQMGGSMPGAVGFMYARTAGSAPANGKYTKKTKASAQNGHEMEFYQNGLDFKPKTISKNGSVIKDDMGQWAHPGEITEIGSNQITMKGVDYPVLGISDTGDTKLMQPGKDYKFEGTKVTEYPKGGWADKYQKGGGLPAATLTESNPKTSITTGVKSGTTKSTSKNLSQKEVAQIEEQDRLNKYLANRGEISAAEAPRSFMSKAMAVLSNPVTAAQYAIAGRGLPEHFDRGALNPLEHAVNIVNPMSYINAVGDVPSAGYEFIKDPSLATGVRLGGDLLQAVPFVHGVAGGATAIGEELSPLVKQGVKTFNATSDIPSLGKRLRNAIYSGTTAKELPGDMMHHAYFKMTPEEVAAKIAAEKANAPAGAMLGDLNMSINSTPLYFTNATREAKTLTPVRTGEMQPTNFFGWRGKRVEDAIPAEIKQKYSNELLEFKNNQLDWENRIKNAAPEERNRLVREKLAYEEDNNPVMKMLRYARQEEPDSYDQFVKNYKPEMDRPIERLNSATGLNFPMSNVTGDRFFPGFYETPTAISIKNPNARVTGMLKEAGKKGLKAFNEESGLEALSKFNPSDIKAANKLKKERINSIHADYERNLNNLDQELEGEDRLFEENYLRDIRDNEIQSVERTNSKQLLERHREQEARRANQDRTDMAYIIRNQVQDHGIIPDRDVMETITGHRDRIRLNELNRDQLRDILEHLSERRAAGHIRQQENGGWLNKYK
jgi:hypothetical protein